MFRIGETYCGNQWWKQSINEIDEYELFTIKAHFNLHAMARIVAIKDMENVPGFKIIMDSSKKRSITVDYQDFFTISRIARTGYIIMTLHDK